MPVKLRSSSAAQRRFFLLGNEHDDMPSERGNWPNVGGGSCRLLTCANDFKERDTERMGETEKQGGGNTK
jgi:hypothetical protein